MEVTGSEEAWEFCAPEVWTKSDFAERVRKRSMGGFGLQVFIRFVFFSAGPRLLARIKNLDPTPKRPLTCLAYRRLVQERANTSHSSAPKGRDSAHLLMRQ